MMVEFNLTIIEEDNFVFNVILSVSTTLLCPFILLGNLLVIIPFLQIHHVRTPSNYLILYLAFIDFSLGALMPIPHFLPLDTRLIKTFECTQLCISIASFSFMVSIALDKAFSLAKPLRYSSVVSKMNVQIYSLGIGLLSPGLSVSLTYLIPSDRKDFQILLLGILLIPCVILSSLAYFYIYTVASRHIQSIRQIEVSVRSKERRDRLLQRSSKDMSASIEPKSYPLFAKSVKRRSIYFKSRIPPSSRFGLNLSLTMGLLLGSRLPGPLGSLFLEHYTGLLLRVLDIPIYICSAFNPWIYAYHNLELKKVMRRWIRRIKKTLCRCSSRQNTISSLRPGISSKTSKKPFGGSRKCPLTTVIIEGSLVSQYHTSNHPTVGRSDLAPENLQEPSNDIIKNSIIFNVASLYAIDAGKPLEL